jgi:hypothetical protein
MEVFFSFIVEAVEGVEEVEAPCHSERSEEPGCFQLIHSLLFSTD